MKFFRGKGFNFMKTNISGKIIISFLILILLLPATHVSSQTGIVLVNISTNVTEEAAQFIAVNKPLGIVQGDFLLAQIAFLKGSDIILTPPVGWQFIRRDNRESNIGSALYYKFATSSEPTQYQWVFSDEDVAATASIIAYRGVSITSPIIDTSGKDGESDHPNAPSVNALDNSKLVALFSIKKDTSLSTPQGMNELYFIGAVEDELNSKAADQNVNAGATGGRTSYVEDVDKWTAQLVALRHSKSDPGYKTFLPLIVR